MERTTRNPVPFSTLGTVFVVGPHVKGPTRCPAAAGRDQATAPAGDAADAVTGVEGREEPGP